MGVATSDILKRFITLLAVLLLIGATICLLWAAWIAVAIIGGSRDAFEVPIFLVGALLFGVLGVTQLLCGIGLLKLKPPVPKGVGLKNALVVILMFGIFAAIAVPSLIRARMTTSDGIGSLRAINSGESIYAESCANGGYAIDLADLVRAPSGSSVGFVSPDFSHNGVIRHGYRVMLSKSAATGVTDIGTAAATCNTSTHTPASSYFASAEPATPDAGTMYFATDQRGTIFQSTAGPIANPIVVSALVVPIQ